MVSFFSFLTLISSIVLIVSVVMQESKSDGMGAISGDSGSLWGKSRGTSKEDMLSRATAISALVFFVSNLVLLAN